MHSSNGFVGSSSSHSTGSQGHIDGFTPTMNNTLRDVIAESPLKASMPIAIIGVSCKFPGDVTSPEKLWELCASARSTWSPIPSDRFNQEGLYHEVRERSGTVSLATVANDAFLNLAIVKCHWGTFHVR